MSSTILKEKQLEDLDASKIVSGQFADARISESSVTQHEAAINHDALTNFDPLEHERWDQAAGSPTLVLDDSRVVASNVTQHNSSLDHGNLNAASLNDDDHTQYALADGSRTFDLGELEDVNVTGSPTLAAGDILVWDGSFWRNNPLSDITITGTLVITSPSGSPVGSPNIPALILNGDLEINSQIRISSGSEDTPSYSFSSDPYSGMWYDGDVVLSVAGSEVLRLGSDGVLSVTSGSPVYENLVTDDDNIPNKKYVDDAITAFSSSVVPLIVPPIIANIVPTPKAALGGVPGPGGAVHPPGSIAIVTDAAAGPPPHTSPFTMVMVDPTPGWVRVDDPLTYI